MTAPLSHGYPDYGRTTARANVFYDFIEDLDIDGAETRPRVFVGDRPYLGFRVQAVTNHFLFRLRFFNQFAGGTATSYRDFSIRQSRLLNMSIPVGGPWFELRVEPSAVNSHYQYWSWGMDAPDNAFETSEVSNVLVSYNDIAIAAGGNRTDIGTVVMPGPATWRVRTASPTWTALLESIDYLGNLTVLDRMDNTTGMTRSLVYLPNTVIQVRTFNQSAAAANYSGFVTVHPMSIYG